MTTTPTEQAVTQALLPCPFCASTDIRRSSEPDCDGNKDAWFSTACDECGASVEGNEQSRADERWNHRATPPTTPARVDEGWMPIDSAPKDGTEIILFGPYPREEGGTVDRVTAGFWCEPEPPVVGDCGGECRCPEYGEPEEPFWCSMHGGDDSGWMSTDGGFTKEWPPTRWKPLLSGPLALATEAAGRSEADVRGGALEEAICKRKAIYEAKRDATDPLADDDSNRHERMAHTVEAFELLLEDVRALIAQPASGGGK